MLTLGANTSAGMVMIDGIYGRSRRSMLSGTTLRRNFGSAPARCLPDETLVDGVCCFLAMAAFSLSSGFNFINGCSIASHNAGGREQTLRGGTHDSQNGTLLSDHTPFLSSRPNLTNEGVSWNLSISRSSVEFGRPDLKKCASCAKWRILAYKGSRCVTDAGKGGT